MLHLELTQTPCPSPDDNKARASCVPEDTIVYAIGDIHGRLDMLTALHQAIRKDVREHHARHKQIIYLGDYFSRGPNSREVLDLLIDQPMAGFEVHHLKGNHEDIVSRFLAGALDSGGHWLKYGGIEGLASFGVKARHGDIDDRNRLEKLRLQFVERMTDPQRKFLEGLEISRREGDYFFVHGGVDPSVPIENQSDNDMMWIRDKFLQSDVNFGAVVVHGHTVSEHPVVKANRIGIDTGAGRNKTLTCLTLEGTDRYFLSVKSVT